MGDVSLTRHHFVREAHIGTINKAVIDSTPAAIADPMLLASPIIDALDQLADPIT